MHSIAEIEQNPGQYADLIAKRGADPSDVQKALEFESKRKQIVRKVDELRAHRKRTSAAIGREKRPPTEAETAEMRALGGDVARLESDLREVNSNLRQLLLTLPNTPLPDVPEGSNKVVRTCGPPIEQEGKPHWDIADELQLFDLKAGANIAGARFALFKKQGAALNRALANWMLDSAIKRFGYTEIEPPLLVRRETMVGSGNLPKFEDNLYHDSETDLWLIPTSEVSLNGIHQNEIIPPDRLPLKYVSNTLCFRKEKTAGGRDIRGVKRIHQFQKVEIFRIEDPRNSLSAQEEMVATVEQLCEELGLAWRVLQLCADDMGFQAARTYDVEVWAPGSGEWLEVSSISTCEAFQARRNNTRYRAAPGAKPAFPHTLNASALALPRIWIALLESGYSAAGGSVEIPAVLHPYTGFKRIDPCRN